jgi:hypothetical protein
VSEHDRFDVIDIASLIGFSMGSYELRKLVGRLGELIHDITVPQESSD